MAIYQKLIWQHFLWKADKNGDGRLSVEEIHGIYLAHGVDVTRDDVQKIVGKVYPVKLGFSKYSRSNLVNVLLRT